MKFENMSDAELDARLKELLEKYQEEKKEMMPQEKIELAELLEEKMFRREPIKFEQAKHTDINGVEHDILRREAEAQATAHNGEDGEEMITPAEKLELAELLEYRTRSAFDIRRDRLRAAERRLGMWENGKFTGRGLAELIARARRHDDAASEGKDNGDRFSQDEFAVLNFGFRNRQEIEDANSR